MKIGIDIDETITVIPELFRVMTVALRKEGHQVFIVTFRDKSYRKETVQDLKDMGIEYDKLVMGNHVLDLQWKAKQAVKFKLDAFFEDNVEVLDEIKKARPECKTFHVRGWF